MTTLHFTLFIIGIYLYANTADCKRSKFTNHVYFMTQSENNILDRLPSSEIILDASRVGRRFDGIGAISGGGVSYGYVYFERIIIVQN